EDEVGPPAREVEASFAQEAEVTRAQPEAGADGAAGGLFVPEVAGHDERAPDVDLADRLRAEGLAFFAADLDLDGGERTTDAFASVLPCLGGVQRAEGRALGEAVADAECLAEVREELADAGLELGRDGRPAAAD